MPLQNRVTPFGEMTAVDARGTFMGNRGIIHDPQTKQLLRRRWQHQAWICCVLSFKDYQHPIMGRSAYTELFFLDEATALSAGHRPCAYCRRKDFNAFKAAWMAGQHQDPERFVSAPSIDRQLHGERVTRRREQVRFCAPWNVLPEGTMVKDENGPVLLWHEQLYPWHARGYQAPRPRPGVGNVEVLTPRSIGAAIRAGFIPAVHHSCHE